MSVTPSVQNYMSDGVEHRRRLANAVNSVMRGKLNSVVTVTLTASSSTTTITNKLLSINSFIGMMPTTANAAAESWYITDQNNGTATINHANNSQTDRTYTVVIIG